MSRDEKLWWKCSAYIRKVDMRAFMHPGFWQAYLALSMRLDRPAHFPLRPAQNIGTPTEKGR